MLLHENPALDRRVRMLLQSMYEQAQRADQQPGLDFSALSYEQLQALAPAIEPAASQALEASLGPVPEGAEPPQHLEIEGIDGYRVPIDVIRPMGPMGLTGPLPCIVYLHGGGMALCSPRSYRAILQHLANQGAVVVAPYFRNSSIARFPAGLHDCLSAVIWARANLSLLGASGVTVAGESGGGCLALTVPLLAHRRGLTLDGLLDGVWADSPICFSASDPAGLRLRTNTDPSSALDLALRRMYTDQQEDACAFPMNASEETLRKLPRTVITIYEADPLREEGLAFYRKMLAAGHEDVDCLQVHGLTHAFMLARAIVPSFSTRQLQRLVAFAR